MYNKYDKLPKDAVCIADSKDYICPSGDVYTPIRNYRHQHSGKYYKKTPQINKYNGYVYVNIYDNKSHKIKKVRLHRLLAETFIPNPNNLPVVGHKNNIKNDNRIGNLYWTTWKENTQKAVNDGLLKTDKSWNDSQSQPVKMFKTTTNELLGVYGSITEAARVTGVPKNTISRQAKYHRPTRKPYYFRYIDDESVISNQIINGYEYKTDKYVGTYYSIADASRQTGICFKSISEQIKKNKKPEFKYGSGNTPIYFLKQLNQVNVNRLSNGDEPSRVAKAKE